MKETICTVIGMVGGFIAALIGGWDSALVTLVIFDRLCDGGDGQVQAQRQRQAQQQGWLGGACKEVLCPAYEDAKSYFFEMMMSTDGEEHDRAECVYIQLLHGLDECSDEEE